MGTYLKMWDHIRTLNETEVDEWVEKLTPALGITVDFFGRDVVDIDLLEGLREVQKDFKNEK